MSGKLHGNKGETVVEVLVSVLICALSVALLFGGIMASARINEGAEEDDVKFYEGFSAAEGQSTPLDTGAVEIILKSAPPPEPQPSQRVDVDIYGGSELFSYAEKAGVGP